MKDLSLNHELQQTLVWFITLKSQHRSLTTFRQVPVTSPQSTNLNLPGTGMTSHHHHQQQK